MSENCAMNSRNAHLLLIALVAVAGLGALIFSSQTLRLIVGLPLIFYLPGHAILRASGSERRNDLENVVFSAGLSLAVTIFCGLLLNLVGPLTPVRWTVALGMITLCAYALAHARERQRPAVERVWAKFPALGMAQALMLACSIAIVAIAADWLRQDALAHPQFAYTELWMVPAGGGAFTVGIKNAEIAPSSYGLEVTLDGRAVTVRRSIELRVGETWIADFALPVRDDETHTAEARLFKHGNDRLVYRRVSLKTGSKELRP